MVKMNWAAFDTGDDATGAGSVVRNPGAGVALRVGED
jgi:hypothetical protein